MTRRMQVAVVEQFGRPLALRAGEVPSPAAGWIFGSDLTHPVEGPGAETLIAAAHAGRPIIAVDVPSALRGDTAETLGAVAATLTVTFFRKAPGHLLLPGRTLCADVVVADAGIPSSLLEQPGPDAFESDPRFWRSKLPRPFLGRNTFERGNALIAGGYPTTGAARMAARAGAGLTTIAVPEISLPICAPALTRVMVRPAATPGDFDALLGGRRISALLTSPGAGTGAEPRARVLAMLATGLVRGMDPFLASAAAGGMHGAAATAFGPGLAAEDLPDLLPGVLRSLHGSGAVDQPPPMSD